MDSSELLSLIKENLESIDRKLKPYQEEIISQINKPYFSDDVAKITFEK